MSSFIPVITALVAFAVTAVMGIPFIPYLRKLKFGQTILDDGPSWHKSKQGTPTMGGIMIVAGVIAALVIGIITGFLSDAPLANELQGGLKPITLIAGLVFALMCGAIGFIDDYIKVVKKRNLGLTAKQKTVLQLLATLAYLITLAVGGMHTTWIPFVGDVNIISGFGLIFWPISLIFIYYMVNAVNLTDDIDGLASSITLVVCCAYMLIASRSGMAGINCLAAAGAGSCVGFIFWNAKPAKVFMGDTGSMFLGGLVVALAYGCGKPILLILAGIVYILEALSVVLQVASFKLTGKRIFKMSPIHHHFEMSGWSEDKICLVFSVVAFVGCFVAALAVYLGW
ncbi:MAG: phospho-N-acetylmuramoyl-pentapeptide-transferase [Clostridia bacterium]|nr:phospho-N-acetylmuramoyl-pentapeptide-transferase [Clostridia bacterium]